MYVEYWGPKAAARLSRKLDKAAALWARAQALPPGDARGRLTERALVINDEVLARIARITLNARRRTLTVRRTRDRRTH